MNWTKFEHQKGPFVLGKANPVLASERAKEKEFYWRYAAPYWINQAPFLKEFFKTIADAPIRDRLITALVEDGLWERGQHQCVVLFVEILWDPDADISKILTAIFHDPRTV